MASILHSDTTTRPAVFWPFWLALACAGATIAWGFLTGLAFEDYHQENGPIETAGFMAFVLAAVAMVALAPERALGRSWFVTVLFALMAARELDFDKRFTEKGVLQLRLYSGDYPLGEKLIGAFFVCLILLAVFLVLRRGIPAALGALRAGQGDWVWVTLAAIAMMVISKPLDGLGRRLEPFGVVLSERADTLSVFFEESLELGFALALVLAVCLWARGLRETSASH